MAQCLRFSRGAKHFFFRVHFLRSIEYHYDCKYTDTIQKMTLQFARETIRHLGCLLLSGMGRTSKKKGKSKRTNNKNIRRTENLVNVSTHPLQPSTPSRVPPYWPNAQNFVASAGPGCHMAHYPSLGDAADWVLGWESLEDDEDLDEETPDLAIDPEDFTLSLYNTDLVEYKIAFVTIYDGLIRGRNGQILSSGTTTSSRSLLELGSTEATTADGPSRECTTLIVLCPPSMCCHMCHLPNTISAECIDSDVQVWVPHPDPQDFHPRTISFPLLSPSSSTAFLCTQGIGGSLTHFLRGNLHAIDFACPAGTPIVAVGHGTVVQVRTDCSHVSGIAVSNLFHWNSILLELNHDDGSNACINIEIDAPEESDEGDHRNSATDGDASLPRVGPLFIEYVHIATAAVSVGERVEDGQVIGTSGGVGFSPEPHLHLAAYRSAEATAPTCGVRFHVAGTPSLPRPTFLPAAGQWYSVHGPVPFDG
jgi:Peptidase family M23